MTEKTVWGDIHYATIYETKDEYWFTTLQFNGLFKMDKNTWEAEYVGSFPDNDVRNWRLFADIAECGKYLVFAPSPAGTIALYDREDRTFGKIDLPLPMEPDRLKIKYNERRKLRDVFNIEGKLIFTPLTYPGIIVYNIKEHTIHVIDDWIGPFNELIPASCSDHFGRYYFGRTAFDAERGVLVIPCFSHSVVVEFDPITYKSSVILLNDEAVGYDEMIQAGTGFWFLSHKRPMIAEWNPCDGMFNKYDISLEGISPGSCYTFQRMICNNEIIYLIPFHEERVAGFNIRNKTFSFVDGYHAATDRERPAVEDSRHSHVYTYMHTFEGKAFMQRLKDDFWTEFDPLTEQFIQRTVKLKNPEKLREYFLSNEA